MNLKKELQILLVEDNENDAFLCVRHLEKSGHNVLYDRVETSEEIIDALKNKKYDLILADYQLPSLNAQLAFKIYESFLIDIPFIVISGAIGEEAAITMIKMGAHDYVLKNNLDKLSLVVERELKNAQRRRDLVKIHEDLLISNAALESSLKTKDEFLILASHELKTPLTSLRLKIQHMEKKLIADNRPTEEFDFFYDRLIKSSK